MICIDIEGIGNPFLLGYSCVYFYVLFFAGNQAMKDWRNLRKRYTTSKKKYKAVNRSGEGRARVMKAKASLDKYQFLQWLDPHITQRNTQTNIPPADEEDSDDGDELAESDDEMEKDDLLQDEMADGGDDDDYREIDPYDDDETATITTNNVTSTPDLTAITTHTITPTSTSVNDVDDLMEINPTEYVNTKKTEKKALQLKPKSRMTKPQRFEMSRSIEKEELGLIRSLSKKMGEPTVADTGNKKKDDRDECDIFGELIATKLRKLSSNIREDAEMALNNTLMEWIVKERRLRTPRQHPPQQLYQPPISPNYPPYPLPSPNYNTSNPLLRLSSASSSRAGSPFPQENYPDVSNIEATTTDPITGSTFTIMGSRRENDNEK